MKKTSVSLILIILFQNNIIAQGTIPSDIQYKKAKQIHERVITIDSHDDINIKNFTQERNYTHDLPTQINLPKMKKGGLDVSWLIVYTGQGELNEQSYAEVYKEAIDKFNAIHRLTEVYAPNEMELALTSSDVKRIHKSGKKVVMIGVENAYPIGTDLSNIKIFYDLGARYMSLSHQGHSQFCDSNTGEKDDVWLHNGLSKIGIAVIKEMNRLGMMIDVSHPSKKSFMDMIKYSKAPLIASHSSARALCNHSRDLDDEQLLLLKENGGVVQTVAFAGYVNFEKNNAYKNAKKEVLEKLAEENGFKILDRKERKELTKTDLDIYNNTLKNLKVKAKPLIIEAEKISPPVNVSDFVDHIDYMVKLIGIDHVGISSDFDGGGGISGWKDASETFNVTHELVKRGYTEDEIAKLWGLNLLRVMDDVQRIAQEIQKKS
ncbi:MAG: dipeptidase [Bacteroidota bacterium]